MDLYLEKCKLISSLLQPVTSINVLETEPHKFQMRFCCCRHQAKANECQDVRRPEFTYNIKITAVVQNFYNELLWELVECFGL